jgi:ABC-type polysaccharide/polyol phosphate transport system ATPase subunit
MNIEHEQVIGLNSIYKSFRLGKGARILGRLLQREGNATHTAIKGIDLSVRKGEVIGVVGGNGSGKTTFAKLIAGIYRLTSGDMKISGATLYISGFGGLIDKNISVTENLYLLGSILGISRKEAKSAMPEILSEAELLGYERARAGSLSDGMLARLSFFSMLRFAKDAEPDILLLDEVLSAGGDMRFREKATEAIRELVSCGVTAFVISHSLTAIESLCARALWFEHGSIRLDGRTPEVIAAYKASRAGS